MLQFDRNYGKWFANDVGRVIGRYRMIAHGERVAVALSGGKDSATLLFILAWLRRFSPLCFDLSAVHVRVADYDTTPLRDLCAALETPYVETELRLEDRTPARGVCALCARLRRGAMLAALRPMGVHKVAYGHHADDAAETLLMNLVVQRRLGALAPVVDRSGGIALIRPMIRLQEATIRAVHAHFGLPRLAYVCPYAESNIRRRFKAVMGRLSESLGLDDLPRRIVAALENPSAGATWPRPGPDDDGPEEAPRFPPQVSQ
jgi:tRNA(Ile)-lysidine synthase TilS/MesJ